MSRRWRFGWTNVSFGFGSWVLLMLIGAVGLANRHAAGQDSFQILETARLISFDGGNLNTGNARPDVEFESNMATGTFSELISGMSEHVQSSGAMNSGTWQISQQSTVAPQQIAGVLLTDVATLTDTGFPAINARNQFETQISVKVPTIVTLDGAVMGSRQQQDFSQVAITRGPGGVFNTATDSFPRELTLTPGATYTITAEAHGRVRDSESAASSARFSLTPAPLTSVADVGIKRRNFNDHIGNFNFSDGSTTGILLDRSGQQSVVALKSEARSWQNFDVLLELDEQLQPKMHVGQDHVWLTSRSGSNPDQIQLSRVTTGAITPLNLLPNPRDPDGDPVLMLRQVDPDSWSKLLPIFGLTPDNPMDGNDWLATETSQFVDRVFTQFQLASGIEGNDWLVADTSQILDVIGTFRFMSESGMEGNDWLVAETSKFLWGALTQFKSESDMEGNDWLVGEVEDHLPKVFRTLVGQLYVPDETITVSVPQAGVAARSIDVTSNDDGTTWMSIVGSEDITLMVVKDPASPEPPNRIIGRIPVTAEMDLDSIRMNVNEATKFSQPVVTLREGSELKMFTFDEAGTPQLVQSESIPNATQVGFFGDFQGDRATAFSYELNERNVLIGRPDGTRDRKLVFGDVDQTLDETTLPQDPHSFESATGRQAKLVLAEGYQVPANVKRNEVHAFRHADMRIESEPAVEHEYLSTAHAASVLRMVKDGQDLTGTYVASGQACATAGAYQNLADIKVKQAVPICDPTGSNAANLVSAAILQASLVPVGQQATVAAVHIWPTDEYVDGTFGVVDGADYIAWQSSVKADRSVDAPFSESLSISGTLSPTPPLAVQKAVEDSAFRGSVVMAATEESYIESCSGYGFVCLPEVGDEVIASFLDRARETVGQPGRNIMLTDILLTTESTTQGSLQLDLALMEPILAAGGSLHFFAEGMHDGNSAAGVLDIDVNVLRGDTVTSLMRLSGSPANVADQLAGLVMQRNESNLGFLAQLTSSNGTPAEFRGLTSLWLVPPQRGSFDFDPELDASDIDQLNNAIRTNSQDSLYDVNFDGVLDINDRDDWVHNLKKTWYGDANLDHEFGSTDLVALFIAGEYEDGVEMNSTWATGDFDGDGDFGTGDLVKAFADGGYEIGPLVATSVPEPDSIFLAIGFAAIILTRCRYIEGVRAA